jgi:hypothetical protein
MVPPIKKCDWSTGRHNANVVTLIFYVSAAASSWVVLVSERRSVESSLATAPPSRGRNHFALNLRSGNGTDTLCCKSTSQQLGTGTTILRVVYPREY